MCEEIMMKAGTKGCMSTLTKGKLAQGPGMVPAAAGGLRQVASDDSEGTRDSCQHGREVEGRRR